MRFMTACFIGMCMWTWCGVVPWCGVLPSTLVLAEDASFAHLFGVDSRLDIQADMGQPVEFDGPEEPWDDHPRLASIDLLAQYRSQLAWNKIRAAQNAPAGFPTDYLEEPAAQDAPATRDARSREIPPQGVIRDLPLDSKFGRTERPKADLAPMVPHNRSAKGETHRMEALVHGVDATLAADRSQGNRRVRPRVGCTSCSGCTGSCIE